MMSAPAAPPVICFVAKPCMCGWYQKRPGGSLAGILKLYWKLWFGWIVVRMVSS
jgi:hypothetical protein